MLIFKKITLSAAETESVGVQLAKIITEDKSAPRFVALYGDLGVGKTAFVRGFTGEISPSATVRSPTFALVNEYKAKPLSVFHFDLYRITDEDDLYSIGFYDYADRPGICITEWTENIEYALPDTYYRVEIRKNAPDTPDSREITIELKGGATNDHSGT